MSTNHTTNYNLNQWEAADKVLRTEFNEDNAKIDAALKANADAAAAIQAKLGNCTVQYSTYVGDGTYGSDHPTTLTLPSQPLLVAVVSWEGELYCFAPNTSLLSPGNGFVYCSWSTTDQGVTLSWNSNGSAVHQFNAKDTYHVLTVYPAE